MTEYFFLVVYIKYSITQYASIFFIISIFVKIKILLYA